MFFRDQLRQNFAPGDHFVSDVSEKAAPANPAVRLIAFYLPQYHPVPENDEWWGRGFTEWTNVTKAIPQFPGHIQPKLPADLGFYDLRNVETIRSQAELAKKYGIYGFCIHYYWFSSKRLLETPLNLLLENPDIDIPLCICWANENWTRRWDGLENDILLAQDYSAEDDIALAKSLEAVVSDRRYIRVDGRPLIIIYRPGVMPDAMATARRWRAHFARAGLGNPYLVMPQAFGDMDPRRYGFDAALEFPPHKLGFSHNPKNLKVDLFDAAYEGTVVEYDDMRCEAAADIARDFTLFRGVCPGWDNEARKPGRGYVFAHSTPDKYAHWLTSACNDALRADDPSERVVFINAWNEWGEGAYLEPDRHYGHAYLAATARTLRRIDDRMLAPSDLKKAVIVSHDANFNGAQLLALNIADTLVKKHGIEVQILAGGGGPLTKSFMKIAPTEIVESGFNDLATWDSIIANLKARGFGTVLCNTVVSAQIASRFRRAGMRVVSLIHELPAVIQGYGMVGAAQAAARYADTVVFPSEHVRDRFLEISGAVLRQTVILPQGLFNVPSAETEWVSMRARVRSRLKIDSDTKIVLGVAYGELRKGVDLWPELVSQVVKVDKKTLFLWVGDIIPDLLVKINAELRDRGVADKMLMLGSTRELEEMYCASDIFALTSREDPFPSVVLEAMSHGMPVVAFEGAGGFTSLVKEVGNDLAPYLDVETMARQILDLLANPARFKSIGRKSIEKIENDYSFSKYVANLVPILRDKYFKVSVIVPNFNYARYLRQRIETIRRQTYPIAEIIILDDCSTDESEEILREIESEADSRIRIVRNPVNSGSVSRQWARGAEIATGDIIWIAEADDLADRDFLRETVSAFEDSQVVMSFCQSRQMDSDGNILCNHYLDYVQDVDPELWTEDYIRDGKTEIATALSVKNTIPNVSAVLFRRPVLAAVLDRYLPDMVSLRNAGDWLCYMRVLEYGSIAFKARSLNDHRRHWSSVTLAAKDARHLYEIEEMQRLAGTLVVVDQHQRRAAKAFREQVVELFGLEPAS